MFDICLNFAIKNVVVSLFTIYISCGVIQITLLNIDVHSKKKFRIITLFEIYFIPKTVFTITLFNKLFTIKPFLEKKNEKN